MRTRLLLLIVLMATALPALAVGFVVDGIRYSTNWYDETTVYVTSKSPKYEGDVVIPASVTYKGKTHNVTSIGDWAFEGCSGLTSINIPDGVTSIGYCAFEGCSGLTSINIPNGMTSIGYRAFEGCSGLTSINIHDGVTSIGDYAFYNCSNLTSINIPNGVTSIGESAFYDCSGLTSIIVDPNNTNYDSRDNCNAIIEKKSNTLVVGCQNTTIPENVTSIGNYAFEGCRGLTSITIPEGVTSIGDGAFNGCSNLTSVIIPSSVKICSDGHLNCFVKDASTAGKPTAAKAEGGVFKITSSAGAANDWDTSFWIGLPKAYPEGTTYAVSFEYKASKEVSIYTHTHKKPDEYIHWAALGTLNFTTEWQTLEFEGTSVYEQNDMESFAFNLSTDKENDITFEIRNISVVVDGGKSPLFSGCEKLDRLTCLAAFPPEIGRDIFEESGLLSGGTVYIPEGTIASYQEKWGTELNYVELADLPQIKDGVGGKTEVVAKDYKQVTLYITIESGYILGDIIVNGVVVYSANKAASDVTVIRNADGTYTLDGVSSTDVIEVTFNKSTPTAVEGINAEKSQKAIKTIEDGKVVIIRDGKKYDVMGREL